jgi:hypothetical protein
MIWTFYGENPISGVFFWAFYKVKTKAKDPKKGHYQMTDYGKDVVMYKMEKTVLISFIANKTNNVSLSKISSLLSFLFLSLASNNLLIFGTQCYDLVLELHLRTLGRLE